ncbi:HAD family hydrolase [Deinococcus planocerae]|uniref:HAD family hydrolase n=1 Tax=Deinococcus planocerae TaxID=1737569 RepID=UPI001C644BD8|nr:HAD family phosphatase [Deinococcus planocerae]
MAPSGFPRPRALLFDIDGTLADTEPLHWRSWRAVLAPRGVEVEGACYRSRVSGRTRQDVLLDLLPGLAPADAARLLNERDEVYRRLARDLTPLPGTRSLLAWAADRGLRLAAVTDATRANAELVLRATELWEAFACIVLAEGVGVGKPDPAPYREALRRLGLAARGGVGLRGLTGWRALGPRGGGEGHRGRHLSPPGGPGALRCRARRAGLHGWAVVRAVGGEAWTSPAEGSLIWACPREDVEERHTAVNGEE